MNDRLFEFVRSVFFTVLAATVTVVLQGRVGARWLDGKLSSVDIAGSLISTVILATLVSTCGSCTRRTGSRRRRVIGNRRRVGVVCRSWPPLLCQAADPVCPTRVCVPNDGQRLPWKAG